MGWARLFNLFAAFNAAGEPFQGRTRICCARYKCYRTGYAYEYDLEP